MLVVRIGDVKEQLGPSTWASLLSWIIAFTAAKVVPNANDHLLPIRR